MEKRNPLENLFELGLRYLYSSEQQAYDHLKVVSEQAKSTQLRKALIHHQEETRQQIERLKRAFEILQIDINKTKIGEAEGVVEKGKEALKSLASLNLREKSKGMDGIIHEGNELMRHFANTDVADLALSESNRKIEHFEIGCYTNLIPLAKQLGYTDIVTLLNASLGEEKEANTIFTQFAEKEVEYNTRHATAHT